MRAFAVLVAVAVVVRWVAQSIGDRLIGRFT